MNKITTLANTFALFGAIIGSGLLASNIGMEVVAYCFFLSSSVASVYLLLNMTDAPKSLVWQNVFFVVVNVFGLYRWAM